jgi:hypothetical protein
MEVEVGVRHAFDLKAAPSHLAVAAVIVGRDVPAPVPREVVDLDVKAIVGQTEVRMDDRARLDLERVLTGERGEATFAERPFKSEFVVRVDRLEPHRA